MAARKQKKEMIKITLVKSLAGKTAYQRSVIRGLGLKKREASVIREKTPEILGMVKKVDFMLKVEEV